MIEFRLPRASAPRLHPATRPTGPTPLVAPRRAAARPTSRDRFAISPSTARAIVSATSEWPTRRPVDERSAMDAIVVIEAARRKLNEHQQDVGAVVERLLVEPEPVAVPTAPSRPHPAGREASVAAAREELSHLQGCQFPP
jgi:hypothetical protein